jgi:hypothetical protein
VTFPRAARVRRPVGGKIPRVSHVVARLDPATEQLIEAANECWLAGEREKCLSLLATVIERGGEAGCFARAELLGVLLHDGDQAAAEAELATLAADPALTEGPCQLVGELLSDHGALTAALEWYDRVLGFWTDERRTAAADPAGRRTADQMLVQQRLRIRKRLGLFVT